MRKPRTESLVDPDSCYCQVHGKQKFVKYVARNTVWVCPKCREENVELLKRIRAKYGM